MPTIMVKLRHECLNGQYTGSYTWGEQLNGSGEDTQMIESRPNNKNRKPMHAASNLRGIGIHVLIEVPTQERFQFPKRSLPIPDSASDNI